MTKSESWINVFKDTCIAFISTSAILLTLLLGFISRNLAQSQRLSLDVATFSLYLAAFVSSSLLVLALRDMPQRKAQFKPFVGALLLAVLVPFLFALVIIANLIIYT